MTQPKNRFKLIRDTFDVPVNRGKLVRYAGEVYRVMSTDGQKLRLRNFITGNFVQVHPTDTRFEWEPTNLDAEISRIVRHKIAAERKYIRQNRLAV